MHQFLVLGLPHDDGVDLCVENMRSPVADSFRVHNHFMLIICAVVDTIHAGMDFGPPIGVTRVHLSHGISFVHHRIPVSLPLRGAAFFADSAHLKAELDRAFTNTTINNTITMYQ
jgi:hypothetical protein